MIPVVDVSHHQGAIDFEVMRAKGVVGVIIRVGDELSSNQPSDRRFAVNVENALEAGLLVGTYMFCRPDRGNAARLGRQYGHAVHASFAGVDFRLGHWPDHENFWGAGPCPLPPNGYDQWVWDHSAALDDILQTRSGIYTGQSHWNSYVRSARHGFRPLWQARYPYGRTPAPGMPTPDLDHFPDDWEDWAMRRPPTPPVGWNQWDGWQFSSAGPGQLYGASSDGLDLCLFRLDTEDAELTPEQARKLDEVHTLLTQGALGYGVEPVAPQVSKNGRLLRSICQKLGIPT